jgi:hypothetical protein
VNIIEAVDRKHYSREEVKTFLERDPHAIDATDDHGRRPLQLASIHGRTDVVRLLVGHGANVDATDDDGRTALHSACHVGATEIARQLLSADALVNVADNDGNTPLHDVVEWSPEEIELIRLLLNTGANVNAENADGETPLAVAVRRKKIYVEDSENQRREPNHALKMIERYMGVEELLEKAVAGDTAIERAMPTFRYAREFDQLFPAAEHSIVRSERDFDEPDGWRQVDEWYSRAPLYGRYVVTLRTAVEIAEDGNASALESPSLDLIEVKHVEKGKNDRGGPKLETEWFTFEDGAWSRLYDSSGDFSSLHIEMVTDRPVDGFDTYWRDME